MTTCVKDTTRLFRCADPEMEKWLHLTRRVKEQLFAGFVRSPPKTVAEFLSAAVTTEKMLQHRSILCRREGNSTSATDIFRAIGSNSEYLRELIHSIVREELQKAAAPPLPKVSSIASVIKDESQQAHTL